MGGFVTDSQKRAWVKPVVTKFAGIDELREHLQSNVTGDGVASIEAMLDQLHHHGNALPDHEERPHKITVGRRA